MAVYVFALRAGLIFCALSFCTVLEEYSERGESYRGGLVLRLDFTAR